MQIFRSCENLPDYAQNTVLVIGNFDGVHLGHQALLRVAKEKSRLLRTNLGVLTFEPHPRALFQPDGAPFRLTPADIKERLLEEQGVDLLFSLSFDWDFASRSAENFIEEILKNGIHPAHIIIGKDFRFGQLRAGTPDMLRENGQDITILEEVTVPEGEIVSSSLIRQALRHGKTDEAKDMLGRPWSMEGIVFEGDKRGRELGYPTANVKLGETLHPAYGVYAAWVRILDDGPDSPFLPSAVNIGIRPMFALDEGQVEAHILDFDRDIYGCRLQVQPVKHLRGEAKFDSLEALITQIEQDCEKVRQILL